MPGFDDAVIGMTEGETKDSYFTPEEAYGQQKRSTSNSVPMAAFGPDFDFILGGTVQGNGPMGPFLAKIQELRRRALY